MKRILTFSLFLIVSIHLQSQYLSDMLERVLPSVVTVAVYKSEATKQILGFRGSSDVAYDRILDLSNAQGSGSGFIIEKNGKKYVITNSHVVEQASSESGSIYVFSIDRSKYEVRIVGGDSFYDLAVLEFIDPPNNEIGTLNIRLSEPRLGEAVYALGNPLGEYPYTVSDGIISAKNRVRGGSTGKFGFLQTTATVIWGNSGGPLIDVNGELVGINSQIAFANRNNDMIWQPQINFALEAILSNRLIDEILKNNGRVSRAFLGIELSQSYQQVFNNLSFEPEWSLKDEFPVLTDVLRASPAFSELNDKIGMVLTRINGVDVRDLEEALGEFEKLKPGETVAITMRNKTGEEQFQIRTQELNAQRNEQLARHLIESDSRISLTMRDDIVSLTINDPILSNPKKREGPFVDEGISAHGKKEFALGREYFVLTVGVSEDSYRSLWRVNNFSDMGAAFRLTGLYGFYDIFLIPRNKPDARPEKLRVNLSDNENMRKLTLWY